MLVSVDDSASLHPPQAALRLRRPKTPRQGISFRNLNRRLLAGARMLVSVEDSASLHPPQAALRLRPPWTPARDLADDTAKLFARVTVMSPGEFLGERKASKTLGRK